ncbi:MAG: polymer-forming cytoskeletal protein [Rhodospirillales bacterium]|nr:polymer-forming cytoskeletal protein [Rhodospirillales bacterium]
MFRRTNPGADAPEPTPPTAARPEQLEEEPAAKVPPRRTAAIPARPLANPGFPIDIGRRAEPHGASGRGEPTPAAGRDKHLIIGKEVRLKGEVTACEKLVVEGEVEIALSGCRTLQIGPTGVFRGTAEVVEADIAGCFEGEIATKERLAVRGTGRVSGKIRYGQITIDAGGQVAGEITGLEAPATPVRGTATLETVEGKSPTGGSMAAADGP